MADETTPEEQNTETAAPAEAVATEAAAPETAAAPEAPAAPEAREEEEVKKDVEQVLCMVSKQMVPIDETIELERKKGEVLRIHARYKKFD